MDICTNTNDKRSLVLMGYLLDKNRLLKIFYGKLDYNKCIDIKKIIKNNVNKNSDEVIFRHLYNYFITSDTDSFNFFDESLLGQYKYFIVVLQNLIVAPFERLIYCSFEGKKLKNIVTTLYNIDPSMAIDYSDVNFTTNGNRAGKDDSVALDDNFMLDYNPNLEGKVDMILCNMYLNALDDENAAVYLNYMYKYLKHCGVIYIIDFQLNTDQTGSDKVFITIFEQFKNYCLDLYGKGSYLKTRHYRSAKKINDLMTKQGFTFINSIKDIIPHPSGAKVFFTLYKK